MVGAPNAATLLGSALSTTMGEVGFGGVGRVPTFLLAQMVKGNGDNGGPGTPSARVLQLKGDVEREIVTQLPDVDVVDVQTPGAGTLRVLIDHPRGVDHELCSKVTAILRPYLDRYTLEVSSPGIPRPLVKPAHYARNVGRAVAVKTHEPIGGRRTFTGVLREAEAERIVVAPADGGDPVEIPLALVRKGHLVEER